MVQRPAEPSTTVQAVMDDESFFINIRLWEGVFGFPARKGARKVENPSLLGEKKARMTPGERSPCQRWTRMFSLQTNGVYSLKWRLTDRYLKWGTLADPRPGPADADQCKSSDFLQELRISGFPRF